MKALFALGLLCLFSSQCAPPPSLEAFRNVEKFASGQFVSERRVLVAAGPNKLLPFQDNSVVSQTSFQSDSKAVRFGSATPISPDGFMLTNHHVIFGDKSQLETVFVLLPHRGRVRSFSARLIWSDRQSDLALLKIKLSTPHYFQFTQQRQAKGTPVIQAGIRAAKLEPGVLLSSVSAKAKGNGSIFEHSTYVQRGDSGGPVLNLKGKLIGINRSINVLRPLNSEIHLKSAAIRPNTAKLIKLMSAHSSRNR